MCHLHLDCRWILFFVEFQIDLSVRRGFCMLPMLPHQVPALSKHHNYICDFCMHNSQNCSKGKGKGLGQFWFFLVSLFFFVVVVLKSDTVQVTKGVFRCNLNLTSAMSIKHASNMLPLCMNEPSCNDWFYLFILIDLIGGDTHLWMDVPLHEKQKAAKAKAWRQWEMMEFARFRRYSQKRKKNPSSV